MLAEHLHQKDAMLAIVVKEGRGWVKGTIIWRSGVGSVLNLCSTVGISYIFECIVYRRWCIQRALQVVSATGTLAWMVGGIVVGDLVLRVEFRYVGIRERRGYFRVTKIMKKFRNALFVWLDFEVKCRRVGPCERRLGVICLEALNGANYLLSQGV